MMFSIGFIIGLMNACLLILLSMRFRREIEAKYQAIEQRMAPSSSQAEIIMPTSKQVLRAEERLEEARRLGKDHLALEEIYEDV